MENMCSKKAQTCQLDLLSNHDMEVLNKASCLLEEKPNGIVIIYLRSWMSYFLAVQMKTLHSGAYKESEPTAWVLPLGHSSCYLGGV